MTDYFTLTELRALPDMSDYDDSKLTAARDWITATIDRVCQTHFVATPTTVTLDGKGQLGKLQIPIYWITALTSVIVDGVDITSQVKWNRWGELTWYRPTTPVTLGEWTDALQNVVVTVDAGYTTAPPADLKQAALQAARYWVTSGDGSSGISPRALSITGELGNVTLASASEDRPTGLPDVDAVILGYRKQTSPLGIG